MKTNKEFIYQRAIDLWGAPLQAIVAIEEMAELTKEISKSLRKERLQNRAHDPELLAEIADVEIMLEQLKWYIPEGQKTVDEVKAQKLKRLEETLIKFEKQKAEDGAKRPAKV